MLIRLNILAQLRAAMRDAWRIAVWKFACVGVLSIVGCRDTVLLSPIVITPPVDTVSMETGPPLDTVQLALPSAMRLASGGSQSCLLRLDGTIVCWGDWAGIGPTPPTKIPTTRDSTGNAVAFAVIGFGARLCVLSVSGVAYCQTGKRLSSGPDSASTPRILVRMTTRHRFREIVSGYGTNCALTPSGQEFCWGDGALGALGNSRFGDGYLEPNPIALATALRFTTLAQGGGQLQCAVATNGGAYCWGAEHGSVSNIPRQAGDCTTFFWQRFAGVPCVVPTPVSGAPPLRLVSTGPETSCGLGVDGRASCWGVGDYGTLGNGATAPAVAAVSVTGGLKFVELTVGGATVCALSPDHRGYCWGNNFRGYLGTGDRLSSAVPVAITGGLAFATISAGFAHVCGITTADDVWCWGSSDYGQLGRDKSLGDASAPIRVVIAVP